MDSTQVDTSVCPRSTFKTVMYVIGIILIIILVLFVLWRIWKSYSDYKKQNPMLIKGLRKTDLRVVDDELSSNESPYKMVPKNKFLPSIHTNGWSYSFWIRVDDWNYKYGEAKHVFHRGDREGYSVSPGLWLHPENNSLMVRLDTRTEDEIKSYLDKRVKLYQHCNFRGKRHDLGIGEYRDVRQKGIKNDDMSSIVIPAGLKCTLYEDANFGGASKTFGSRHEEVRVSCLLKTPMYNGKTWNDKLTSIKIQRFSDSMNPIHTEDFSLKKCDISNLPIQRWVHIAMVLHNKTLDIFMNGKLHRSCTFDVPPHETNGDLHITDNGGFRGYLGDLRYFNRVLSPEAIFSIYNKGVNDTGMLSKMTKKLRKTFDKKCY